MHCRKYASSLSFVNILLTLKYEVNLLNVPLSSVIAAKCGYNFDCDWQCVNMFYHCVTLIRVLLSQIIFYSDTKALVLVMECKCSIVIYVYELIILLHT